MSFLVRLSACKAVDLNDRLVHQEKSYDPHSLWVEIHTFKHFNEEHSKAIHTEHVIFPDSNFHKGISRIWERVDDAIRVYKRHIEAQVGPWEKKRIHQPRIWGKHLTL